MPSLLGPVPVKVVPDIKAEHLPEGQEILGRYTYKLRLIELRADMDPRVMWHTLIHERVHVILGDAGVRLTSDQEETVCDAIATALTAELMVGLSTGRKRAKTR